MIISNQFPVKRPRTKQHEWAKKDHQRAFCKNCSCERVTSTMDCTSKYFLNGKITNHAPICKGK